MSKGDVALTALASAFFLCLVAVMVAGARDRAREQERRIERHRRTMARYQSPVERTDAQRLDWLTAHPTLAPWTVDGTDPRHEIDYAMDQEQEAQP